jgi:hypothetical protein
VVDEITNSKTVYLFRSNNELLISKNGKVEKAKWEYLGQNSILIDLKDESYLFRHGFFDENILALKIDSKDEYAVLVNESKYEGEINTIAAVVNFLDQKYLVNPNVTNKLINNPSNVLTNLNYQGDGYTLKMGSFKEFTVRLNNGRVFEIYQKNSNGKYFIYTDNEILLFPTKEICLKYIEGQIK